MYKTSTRPSRGTVNSVVLYDMFLTACVKAGVYDINEVADATDWLTAEFEQNGEPKTAEALRNLIAAIQEEYK
jgi:hypothetical protein